MASANMIRVEYPYKTTTQALSVFDKANQYRPLYWLDAPNQIDWLNQTDNGVLLTLLEMLPYDERPVNQPIVYWTEASRLDISSPLVVAATANDTVLKLEDPRIVGVGNLLVFPADGEVVRVVDTNYDLSNTGPTWQNSASIVGNIKVERGVGNTAKLAKNAGTIAVALPKFLAEQEDLKPGIGQVPGLSQYQYISVVGQTWKVTKRQQESLVYDNWGQLERAQIESILDLRRKLGKALLFAPRFTEDRGADGQLYVSGGITTFIKTNVLDLGTHASNHTWEIYDEFFWNLFRADASSQEKTMITGETMYGTMLKMARAMQSLDRQPYWEPSLKADAFSFVTSEGHRVNVIKDRFGLAANEGLADWAFVLDMAHISGLQAEGFPFQLVQNLQDNRSVQVREDGYWGSFGIVVKHESCHGIIRGGQARPTVNVR